MHRLIHLEMIACVEYENYCDQIDVGDGYDGGVLGGLAGGSDGFGGSGRGGGECRDGGAAT